MFPSYCEKKLDAKGRKAIFLGYDCSAKAYRLMDIETSKIVISRDVIFHEESFSKDIGQRIEDKALTSNVLISTSEVSKNQNTTSNWVQPETGIQLDVHQVNQRSLDEEENTSERHA